MTKESGFRRVFDRCAAVAASKENLEALFPTFREEMDVFHFLTAVGSQKTGPDKQALGIAMRIDPLLCYDYMSQPKSHLGYASLDDFERWDVVDSRHIMMCTQIFNHLGSDGAKRIVEIGGGFGNWVRLNAGIIAFEKWSIVDLPFVSRLQRWYLSNVLGERIGLVEFVDTDQYAAWSTAETDIDLAIGAHSLSELDWTTFETYYRRTLIHAKYLFYATHLVIPTPDLVEKKLDFIAEDFHPVAETYSEGGTVRNILYRRRSA